MSQFLSLSKSQTVPHLRVLRSGTGQVFSCSELSRPSFPLQSHTPVSTDTGGSSRAVSSARTTPRKPASSSPASISSTWIRSRMACQVNPHVGRGRLLLRPSLAECTSEKNFTASMPPCNSLPSGTAGPTMCCSICTAVPIRTIRTQRVWMSVRCRGSQVSPSPCVTGKAIWVKSGFHREFYRPGFDVSMPHLLKPAFSCLARFWPPNSRGSICSRLR